MNPRDYFYQHCIVILYSLVFERLQFHFICPFFLRSVSCAQYCLCFWFVHSCLLLRLGSINVDVNEHERLLVPNAVSLFCIQCHLKVFNFL